MSGPNWCEAVRVSEGQFIEAISAADAALPLVLRARMSISLAKQNLSHFIRSELQTSGLHVLPTTSGNSDVDYVVWKGTAVIRVKGLNRRGLPSNYPTDTSLKYHLGEDVDSLPDLPPLPRVDLSYRLDEDELKIRCVEFIEWFESVAVRRYQLPMCGMPRAIEIAEEIQFPVMPTVVRPRRDEVDRRRADEERGKEA